MLITRTVSAKMQNFLIILKRVSTSRLFSSSSKIRVRFAPSPTGNLHLGGLRTALYNYLFSRKGSQGTFILRIEDTDRKRTVPRAAENIQELLEWFGLVPDEGPAVGGPCSPYIQSQRLDLYKEAVKTLIERNAAYRCFCTENDLKSRNEQSNKSHYGYDNRCRNLSQQDVQEKLSAGQPYVVRFKLENKDITFNDLVYGPITMNIAEHEGDPIILKSDGHPTYHLASVVDDHLMNISHVLRGMEWQTSTPKHIMMYAALSWHPPLFAHLPLALNPDGSKLSKRENNVQISYLKEAGYFPEAILNYVTLSGGGINHEKREWTLSLEELAEKFRLEEMNVISASMGSRKLKICNHQYLRKLLNDKDGTQKLVLQMKQLLTEKLQKGSNLLFPGVMIDEYIERVLQYYGKERICRLPELLSEDNMFLWIEPKLETSNLKIRKGTEETVSLLKTTVEKLKLLSEINATKENITALLKETNQKKSSDIGTYMALIRAVLSGSKEGVPVSDMICLLGFQQSLVRLENAIRLLERPEQVSNKVKGAGDTVIT